MEGKDRAAREKPVALLGLEQLIGCSVPSWVFSTIVRLFSQGREGEGRQEGRKQASGFRLTLGRTTFIHG